VLIRITISQIAAGKLGSEDQLGGLTYLIYCEYLHLQYKLKVTIFRIQSMLSFISIPIAPEVRLLPRSMQIPPIKTVVQSRSISR